MPKKKLSMSAKIRNLLDQKVEPKAIAKRLDIEPSYVHTIKWAYNNKGKKKAKKVKVPAVEDLALADAIVDKPTPVFSTLDLTIRNAIMDRVDAVIVARVEKVMESL